MPFSLRLQLAIAIFCFVATPQAYACNWPEAKVHIDWALSKDADRQYHRSRKCGARVSVVGERVLGDECLSKWDALMEAQSHNGHAQHVIRQCRAQSLQYLNQHG